MDLTVNATCGTEKSLEQTSGIAIVGDGVLQLFLCALLVVSCFAPMEIISATMFFASMLLLADPYARQRQIVFPGAGYFSIIMIVGVVGASGNVPFDIVKDIWYVGNAVLTILFGCLLAQRMNSVRPMLRAFVGAAAIVSAVHIGRFILNPSYLSETLIDLRAQTGAGYLISAIGIVILLGDARFRVGVMRSRLVSWAVVLICLASVTLSLSRTLWVALLTAVIAATLKTSIVTVLRLAAVAAGVVLLLVVIGSDASKSDTITTSTFFDKLVQSPQELKVSSYDSLEDIGAHWRGFETYRALLTYESGGLRGYLLGGGFGTNVDLGFVMTLADEEFSEIPVLHNGYMFLLVKVGAVGLSAYLIFLISTFRTGMRLTYLSDVQMRFCGLLLVALTFIMFESTLVIAGMFNKYWLYPATLLMGIILGHSGMVNPKSRKRFLLFPFPAVKTGENTSGDVS